MAPLPELLAEFAALKAPGAVVVYMGGPQFWWAAAYPLATLLWRGHTWLPLLLVASCCGGWWAGLLAQGRAQAGGSAGSFLWALLSTLPSASQVLVDPWLHGIVVKGTPYPSLLTHFWRGELEHQEAASDLFLRPVAALYQFLGCLPAVLLSRLHLAPHWFPQYILEVLALIAFQASVPFGVLSLLYCSSLKPRAVLWWPVSAPIGCICAALLAYYDFRWLCDRCISLLNRVGLGPVANAIQSSVRYILAGVFWVLVTGVVLLAMCCFDGIRALARIIQVCLRWGAHGLALLAEALISARESWISRVLNAVNTKLQGLLTFLDPRKLNAPAGKQRRGCGGYVDDGCLGMLQSSGTKAARKQKGGVRKSGKAPAPVSRAGPSSPAAAPPADTAGQSSQPSDTPASQAGPSSPFTPASACAQKKTVAAAAAAPPAPASSKERAAAAAAAEPLPKPLGKAPDSSVAQTQPPVVGQRPPLHPCAPAPSLAAAAEQTNEASTPKTSTRTGSEQQGRQRWQQQQRGQHRQQRQQRQPTPPTKPAAQLQQEGSAPPRSSQPSHSSSNSAVGPKAAYSTVAASPQGTQPAQAASAPAAPATGAASSSQPPAPPATRVAPAQPALTTAAAVGTVHMAASPVSAVAAAEGERDLEEEECVLCLEHGVQCVLVPCGHLCLCLGCTRLLFGADGSGRGGSSRDCPMCRQQVLQWVKVHRR